MANPVAEVEIRARNEGFAAGLREAKSQYRAFADHISAENSRMRKGKGESGFGIAGALGVAGGNLISSGISKGIGFLEDMGKAVYQYDDKLVRLGITAESSPAKVEEFNQAIRKASDQTGISKASLLDAGSQFVALTGEMGLAKDQLISWARVAQATNSSITDISSASAALMQQMKIDPSQMERALEVLAIQGKKGAVELKDLAGGLSQIAPQWAQFANGRNVRGVQELGAALQIVKRGFGGDASETITGLQSLLTSLVKNAGKFGLGDSDIFTVGKDGKKQFRDVLDIVDAIGRSKIVNNPTAMEKAFGRVEAYRAFIQLNENREALQGLIDASGEAGVIQKDLDTYLNSRAGKTALAWEQAKNKMAEVFTPERIQAFGNALARVVDLAVSLVDKLDKVAAWVSANSQSADDIAKGKVNEVAGKTSDEQRARADQLDKEGAMVDDARNRQTGLAPGLTFGVIADWFGGGGASSPIVSGDYRHAAAAQIRRNAAAEDRAPMMGPDENPMGEGSPRVPYAGGDIVDKLRAALEQMQPTFNVTVQVANDVLVQQIVESFTNRTKVAK